MTPEAFAARLAAGPVLLDGGLGTLLMAAGLAPGEAPERWNLERPAPVLAAHRAYVEAGSAVIHSNTFGASPPKLAAGGLAGLCREVCARAVALAREAAAGRALVAGDLGPTGLLRPPLGQADAADFTAAYEEQARALAAAGADLLSIETQYDLQEALAALRAARATGLPVIASMTFDLKKRGAFTLMGDPLVPSLQALAREGADAVGLNCSVASATMLAMAAEAAPALAAPLAVQPNAGQPRATPGGVAYDADPAAFAADLVAMARAGARLLGGCCGTDPSFIREVAARLATERPEGSFRA